jgi:hypothetical protein
VKLLAFVLGLCILAVGAGGILAPSSLVWTAQHFATLDEFLGLAIVRVAFGLVLISAAPASRTPKALRVLGFIVVLAGITTAIIGLVGIERARAMIDWWLQQGPAVIRLTGVPIMVLGGFVAYACAPARRAA